MSPKKNKVTKTILKFTQIFKPEKYMFLKKSFLLFLIFIYSLNIQAQTAGEIISKYIEFIGGKKQWKTVNTIVTSGKYNYGGLEFPFSSFSKTPDLYKFVVPLKEKYYIQAFDGKQGWKIDAFNNETKPVLLSGKPARAMANEADVEIESPFIDYGKKGHTAIAEGKDTIGSKMCYRIKFIRRNGEEEIYFFSTDNFELVMKRAISKNVEMKNAILDTFYSDYHELNGVKIPFKSVSKLKDQTVLTISIEKAEFNIPVANNVFAPPD